MVTYKLKLGFYIIFNILFTFFIFGQDHGINWILGYGIKNDSSLFGRSILAFSGDSLKLIRNSGGFKFTLGFENNSYSDDQGKLLFFYDGFRLGNAIDFSKIENGDTLNPGFIWNTFFGAFYPISDASFFLPPLKSDSILFLIHMPLDTYPNAPVLKLYSPNIYITKIDMNANNGKGKVLSKNNVILKGDFSSMVCSCCKHSNGRDWWLIYKSNVNSTYYKILLINNEICKIDSQFIGQSVIDYSTDGNSIFSPNGKKFAKISYHDGIQIFDFDRCEGKLFNFIQILNDSIRPSNNIFNVAISSNNRFLYASTSTQIYQYDLEASDIQSSSEIIGEWDGFIYDKTFTTSFFNMQLAPDGKIYVSCNSGNIYLHVIDRPNLKGKNCDFRLRKVTLPTYIAGGLGNYPNYLLGPEKGSNCDSLTSTYNDKSEKIFSLYPNPSNGKLQIINQLTDYSKYLEIKIINISGTVVFRSDLRGYQKQLEFDFSYLNPGLYLIQFYQNHLLIQSSKWIVY